MGGLLVPYDFSRLLRNSVLSIVAIKRTAILLLSRLEASLSWNVRCLHWYFPDKLYAVLLHQKMYVRKAKRSVSVIKKNRMGYSAKPHRRITRFNLLHKQNTPQIQAYSSVQVQSLFTLSLQSKKKRQKKSTFCQTYFSKEIYNARYIN